MKRRLGQAFLAGCNVNTVMGADGILTAHHAERDLLWIPWFAKVVEVSLIGNRLEPASTTQSDLSVSVHVLAELRVVIEGVATYDWSFGSESR